MLKSTLLFTSLISMPCLQRHETLSFADDNFAVTGKDTLYEFQ